MNQAIVDALLEILHDEDFRRLHRQVLEQSLSWDDFKSLAMPLGLSAEQAWDIVVSLRKDIGSGGCVHQIKPLTRSWHADTPSVLELIKEIDALCSPASPLSKAMGQRSVASVFTQALCDEMMAAVRRDGYVLNHETIRGLLLHEQMPQNLVEAAVLNAHELSFGLDTFLGEPFNMRLVDELLKVILEEGDPKTAEYGDLQAAKQSTRLCSLQPQSAGSQDQLRQDTLDLLFETGNGTGKHPLQDAMGITFIMLRFKPFPAWNGLLELVLRRLVLQQHGYGALSCLPYSKMHLAFETPQTGYANVAAANAMKPARVAEGRSIPTGYGNEAAANHPEGRADDFASPIRSPRKDDLAAADTDYTPRILALLGAILEGAQELQAIAIKADERDARLGAILSADPYLNARQRNVCDLALKKPDVRLSISGYAQRFGIVKGSARNDLLGLHGMGLIRKTKEGKELVFFFRYNCHYTYKYHIYVQQTYLPVDAV